MAADNALFPLMTKLGEQGIDDALNQEENTVIPDDFFGNHLKAGMQAMTTQFIAGGLQEMAAIGGFMDASQQLATQRLFQEKTAFTHKNYTPAVEMCTIGTVANGLGAAFQNGAATATLLEKRSSARQQFAQYTATGESANDVEARLQRFQKNYCDPRDNNLSEVCQNAASAASVNKDVDFTGTLGLPLTINVNFADGNLNGDERDVLALQDNLYATRLLPKISQAQLNQPGNQSYILDWRAIIAKRAVAENSFNALVGLKAADPNSAAANAKYLNAVLAQLGVSNTDAASLIGAQPSYYARMELLTKKIAEQPAFYTALYDTPANVARKGAALRAVNLMQHMDMFDSQLRNEAMLAELVELSVTDEQERVQNNLNPLRTSAGQ